MIPRTLVTHKDCMDGSMCAVVWRTTFPDGEVIFVDPHEAGTLEDRDAVFADVCPRTLGAGDLVFDHHTSSWDKLGDDRENERVTLDVGTCGCGLLLNHLLANELDRQHVLERLTNTCQIVDDYDRWQLRRPVSRHLARIHQFLGQARFVEMMLEYQSSSTYLGHINDFGVMPGKMWDLSKTLEEAEERYVDRALRTLAFRWIPIYGDIRGGNRWVPTALVLADENVNAICQRVMTGYDDVDMVAVVSTHNRKVSLRGRGRIDLARLAFWLDGGGHPDAAGFPLPGETVGDIWDAALGDTMGVTIEERK